MADGRIDISTRVDTSGLTPGLHEISKKIKSLNSDFTKQAESVKNGQAALEDLRRELEKITKSEIELKSIKELELKLKSINAETTAVKEANKELIAEYENAVRVLEEQKSLGFTGEQLAIATAEVDRLAEELRPVDDILKEINERAETLKTRIAEIRLTPETSDEAAILTEKIVLTEAELERAKEVSDETKGSIIELYEESNRSGEGIRTFGEKITQMLSGTSTMVTGIASSFGKLGSKILSGIGSIKLFGKGLLGLRGHANHASNGFQKLSNRITRMIETVFVFNVINKAMSEMRNLIGELMQTNDQFSSSFNVIKVNLLTAFAPIWETIQPALISFMQVLAKVTATLASFISLLFGKTYAQSKASAKAIYDQSKAMDKAGKSGKNASKGLAAFDEINQNIQDSAGDSGAAIEGLDFEAVTEPDITWIDELADKFKNIFKEIDFDYWFDIGTNIAKKITEALDSIPWDTIRESARNLGANLAGLLGGILSNRELWESLGHTIAQGLNTALDFLNSFAKKFSWRETGEAIGHGINTFIDGFDWELASETFNNWALGILDLLIGILDTVEWDKLGVRIAEMLNGIKWKEIFGKTGEFAAKLFNAILEVLNNFAITFNWVEFGKALASGVNTFFSTFNWTDAGLTLSNLALGLLDTIIAFLRDTDWHKIGESIKEFLSAIDWQDILQGVTEIISLALKGIIDLLTGLTSEGTTAALITVASLIGGVVLAIKGLEIALSVANWIDGLNKGLAALGSSMTVTIGSLASLVGGIALVASGLVALIKGITDLIFNWDEMDTKSKIINISLAVLGGAFITLGVAIAAGISAATLGIGALVAAIAAAVTALIGFIVKLATEESAIKSTEEAANNLAEAHENVTTATGKLESAQENVERATNDVTTAQERLEDAENAVIAAKEKLIQATDELTSLNKSYINSVKDAEKAAEKLAEAEERLGISGEELSKQVAKGVLDYKDMDAAQREVYEAYMDNAIAQEKLNNTMTDFEQIQYNAEQAAKNLTEAEKEREKSAKAVDEAVIALSQSEENAKQAAIELTEAKKNETTAHWDNELALAAANKDYESYRDAVVDAFEKGELSAEQAQEALSKAMTGMSEDVRKTFTEDMPEDIKNGLDPKHYETTGQKISNWFKNVGNDMINKFKDVFGIHSPSKVMQEISGNLMDGLKSGWETITGWFGEKVLTPLENGFKSVFNTILGFAESFANMFIKGINSMISGAIGILNGFIRSANLIPNVNIPLITAPQIPSVSIPRLATGLDYVPYDDFPAYLHKGERVLTAAESTEYSKLTGTLVTTEAAAMSAMLSNFSPASVIDSRTTAAIVNKGAPKSDPVKLDKESISILLNGIAETIAISLADVVAGGGFGGQALDITLETNGRAWAEAHIDDLQAVVNRKGISLTSRQV